MIKPTLALRITFIDNGSLGVVGPLIDVQDILHRGDKRGVLLGRNHPARSQVRPEFVFLSVRCTVRYEMLSMISRATSSSASSFSVHRLCPFGGSLQANAINRASLAPSSFLSVGGLARFFRSRAESSPSNTKRFRMPSTVDRLHEKASVICRSSQAGPSASALRST